MHIHSMTTCNAGRFIYLKTPSIETKFEWRSPDRKRHNVILFGSWNGFTGETDHELEYQGCQIFACNIHVPLGTHLYRFFVDNKKWVTHSKAPKTIKNGVEYNQITITTDSDQDGDDMEDSKYDEEDAGHEFDPVLEDGKIALKSSVMWYCLSVVCHFMVFNISTDKARGTRSVELHLKPSFSRIVGDKDAAKLSKKRRSRMKISKKCDCNHSMDKELAKYVFKLQKKHDDEINRLKKIWRQERQIRVERHKKVVAKLRDTEVK